MLRQKASLPSVVEFAENRCGLNNEPPIPAAVSHFSAGWNPSPSEATSQLVLWSHSLVLIIVRPSIWHEIDVPLDVMKSPGLPLMPASQWGPVFARLALRSVHTRTNLIWPEGGSCDWWFYHISSATAIWAGSTAVRVCVEMHECTNVWMNRNSTVLVCEHIEDRHIWIYACVQRHVRISVSIHIGRVSCTTVATPVVRVLFVWQHLPSMWQTASPFYPGFVKESSKCQRVPLTPTGFLSCGSNQCWEVPSTPRRPSQKLSTLPLLLLLSFFFFFS